MYLLPKLIHEKLDKQRRTFFWQGGGQKKKYHLLRWDIINKSKTYGGLGIKNIHKMNVSLCLLCEWWWKVETENDIWQQIVKKKIYVQRHSQFSYS